jgi:hypothetical protein
LHTRKEEKGKSRLQITQQQHPARIRSGRETSRAPMRYVFLSKTSRQQCIADAECGVGL